MSQTLAASPTADEAAGPPVTPRASRVGWGIAFGAGLVVALGYLYSRARNQTFFFDEWNFILDSRGSGPGTLLAPHGGHLVVVPLLIYKVLLATFGLGSYAPYLIVGLAVHGAIVTLVFLLLRRRMPDLVALAGAVIILFLGRGAQDFFWPFQITFTLSVAGGLGALYLLERKDRVGDVAAMLCVAVALTSSGLGIPVALGIGVELLWTRTTWKRIWVVAAPVVLYGVWYLKYGESEGQRDNIPKIPAYVGDAASGAIGALFGKDALAGRYLLGIGGVLVGASVWVQRRVSPRVAALVVTPAAFWTLTAYSRAEVNEPAASRYVYAGAIWILLLLGEAWDNRRVPNWGLAVVAAVVAFSLAGSLSQIGHYVDGLTALGRTQRAELGALVLAPRPVNPAYQPDVPRAPQIRAGTYLSAIREFGGAGDSISQIRAASETNRIEADRVLAEGSGLVLAGATVPAGASCSSEPRGTARLEQGTVTVTAPGGQPAIVGVAVFARAYRTIGQVAPGTTATVVLPPIHGLTWRVQVHGATQTCVERAG